MPSQSKLINPNWDLRSRPGNGIYPFAAATTEKTTTKGREPQVSIRSSSSTSAGLQTWKSPKFRPPDLYLGGITAISVNQNSEAQDGDNKLQLGGNAGFGPVSTIVPPSPCPRSQVEAFRKQSATRSEDVFVSCETRGKPAGSLPASGGPFTRFRKLSEDPAPVVGLGHANNVDLSASREKKNLPTRPAPMTLIPVKYHPYSDLKQCWTPFPKDLQNRFEVVPTQSVKLLVDKICALMEYAEVTTSNFDAVVVYCMTLNRLHVWMAPRGHGRDLVLLMAEFREALGQHVKTLPSDHFQTAPMEKTIVLAPYGTEFYRGIVVESCRDEPKVLVHFLDYGNVEWVPFADLLPCMDECGIEAFPALGYDCKLSDVEYGSAPKSEEQRDQIRDVLSSCQDNAEILTGFVGIGQDDYMEIDLYFNTGTSLGKYIQDRCLPLSALKLRRREGRHAVFARKTEVRVLAVQSPSVVYCCPDEPDSTRSDLHQRSVELGNRCRELKPEITTTTTKHNQTVYFGRIFVFESCSLKAREYYPRRPDPGSFVCCKTRSSFVRGRVKQVYFGLYADVEPFDFGQNRVVRVPCVDLHPLLPAEVRLHCPVVRCCIERVPNVEDACEEEFREAARTQLLAKAQTLLHSSRNVVMTDLRLVKGEAADYEQSGADQDDIVYETATAMEVSSDGQDYFTELAGVLHAVKTSLETDEKSLTPETVSTGAVVLPSTEEQCELTEPPTEVVILAADREIESSSLTTAVLEEVHARAKGEGLQENCIVQA